MSIMILVRSTSHLIAQTPGVLTHHSDFFSNFTLVAFISPEKSSRPADPNIRIYRGHAEPGPVECEALEAAAKDYRGRCITGTPPAPSDSDLDMLHHLVKEKRAAKNRKGSRGNLDWES